MIGNPRCQCGEKFTAHPERVGHTFRNRLARGKPLGSAPRKSRHAKRRSPIDDYADSLGLRRSTTPGRYKRRLWDLVSLYIRTKYADPQTGMATCVTCGKVAHWKELQAGHFVAKKAGLAVYFEERNIHIQCVRCNKWERGNLVKYAVFMVKTYGAGIVEELDALGRTERQIKEPEYLELIAKYQEKVKAI